MLFLLTLKNNSPGNFDEFSWKFLWWKAFLIKLQADANSRSCFPEFQQILRTLIFKNAYETFLTLLIQNIHPQWHYEEKGLRKLLLSSCFWYLEMLCETLEDLPMDTIPKLNIDTLLWCRDFVKIFICSEQKFISV